MLTKDSPLVLEPYGESYAWLRPKTNHDPEPDEALYWPTESGRDLCRRWRAEEATFRRGPRISEL